MDYEKFAQLDSSERAKLLDQISAYIGSVLGAIPGSLRETVTRQALRKIGQREISVSDHWRAIPPGSSIETAAGITTGLGALTQALLGASPAQSVADVIADARTIASGIPTEGDPEGASLLPSAAAVLLQSAADSGSPDLDDPEVVGALISIADSYDCAAHTLPLGGGLIDSVKSWWKGTFGSDEEKAAYAKQQQEKQASKAAAKANDAKMQAVTSLVKGGMPYQEAYDMVFGKNQQPEPESDAAESAEPVGVNNSLKFAPIEDSIDSLRTALAMSKERLSKEKEDAESAAIKLAKLRWAQAVLGAPDSVAKLIGTVEPDWNSPGGALQTAMDLLAQAKDSGELPTVKIFSRLFQALKNRKPETASWLSTLFGGDPNEFLQVLDAQVGDDEYAEELAEALRAKGGAEDMMHIRSLTPEEQKEVIEL